MNVCYNTCGESFGVNSEPNLTWEVNLSSAIVCDICKVREGSKANKDKTRPMQFIPPVDVIEKAFIMCLYWEMTS